MEPQVARFDRKIPQYRFYSNFCGEFRAIFIGNQAWINRVDVSRFTDLEPNVISQIAGESRTVSIPNSGLSYPDNPSGSEMYIRLDTVCKLLRVTETAHDPAWSLERWLSEELLSPPAQLESGRYVNMSTLHQMLGKHFDYSVWVGELVSKHNVVLERVWLDMHYDRTADLKLLLTEAYEIAIREGGTASMLAAILIREGGFFHGGALAEPVDATLSRFFGLVPDRSGRIEARKVHEFTNAALTFDAWVEEQELKHPARAVNLALRNDLITLDEAVNRGLWNDRLDFYPECWESFEPR